MPKNPLDMLFGEKSAKGYQSHNVGKYENELYDTIQNRKKNPLTGAAGVSQANAGYDYSPVTQALSGYKNASYNPYKFNFQKLPDEYATEAYNSGSRNVLRNAEGNAQKMRQQIGARNTGAIYQANRQNQIDTGEQLGDLNSKINLNRMNQNVELGRAQQEAQAGENYKSAGYDLDRFGRMGELGLGSIKSQAGNLQSERDYQDAIIKYLQDLYATSSGATNQGASTTNAGRDRGMFGDILKAASGFAGA